MTLAAGARLGPYAIVSPLGSGGMGEVYKARDTRLDRTVAIKVLPADVASDPGLRARFEREARAIATLDHPHICALHDVGEHEGLLFLVMQHLEGETLAARLEHTKGPLPLAQALTIAIEIADALDKAHRAGIVHRDLKPANIMLTKAGAKLLDFGLAKRHGPDVPISISGMTRLASPTPNTETGTILGTVHYMAPEQVEGREVDAHADIWALGAVVYEMVTGRRPFEGDSAASVIGAILKDTPVPLATRQPLAPPLLDRVVAGCLHKDVDRRWQSAADVRAQLEWLRDGASIGIGGAPPSAGRRSLGIGFAVGVAAAATALALLGGLRPRQPAAEATRLQIAPPAGTSFVTTTSSVSAIQLALSPDGRRLAFVAVDDTGTSRIWVRAFDEDVSRPVAGSEYGTAPFWSPDGKSLAFFARGKLRRVDPRVNEVHDVAEAMDTRGGTWLRDETIVFAGPGLSLFRVAASGGTPERLEPTTASQGSDRWPRILPGGRHLLFLALRGDANQRGLYAWPTAGGTAVRLMAGNTPAAFAPPGYLLFLKGATLFAQPFDASTATLSGMPKPVTAPVGVTSTYYGSFDTSDTGVLVYGPPLTFVGRLAWYTRAGDRVRAVAEPRDYIDLDLSADDQRLLTTRFDHTEGTADVWLLDFRRGTDSRVTSESSITGSAVWSPDGSQIVFRSTRRGVAETYLAAPSGGRVEGPLIQQGVTTNPSSWRGDTVVYHETAARTGWDIWETSVRTPKPVPLVQTGFNEIHGQLSPDGRWLAYTSDESGRWEVYVQPHPTTGVRWPVSTGGGFEPRWRQDGRELLFLTPQHEVMSAAIATQPAFEVAVPRRLFTAPFDVAVNPYRRRYVISSDASRILINEKQESGVGAINVVLNWPALLKP